MMQLYGNEKEVGAAIRNSGIDRRDIFVTTKLWESEWGYRRATSCIQDRLAALDLEEIDLLLLHTPGNPNLRAETWAALEQAHSQVSIKHAPFCGTIMTSGLQGFNERAAFKLLISAYCSELRESLNSLHIGEGLLIVP